jgi:REP element-mobilizing transposase RayT
VTTRGNGGCRVFHDVTDRETFLDLLDRVVVKYRWEVYAWCLLGNHFHLVVRAPREPLHRGMQRLKGLYAIRFHQHHLTSGHLFKRPYDSRPILTIEHLHRACGYTLRNPVRHGFVERAEEWEWSSFRVSARLAPAPRRHLACEPFDRLLELDTEQYPLPTLRAYVLETDLESATTAA